MDSIIHLTHSTYAGYSIIIPRITYISKVGYNNKMKEYYFDLGYESNEFTKFTLSFNNQTQAEVKRTDFLDKINKFFNK